jgi:hypothetical protein
MGGGGVLNFDPADIALVTLVGYFEGPSGQNQRHIQIPIAPEVQSELEVMLGVTLLKLGLPQAAAQLPDFSPAEKYSGEEPCKLPLATAYMADLVAVMALQNLPSNTNALQAIDELKYYYGIFSDGQGRSVWAFRRAGTFKGVAKSKLAFIRNGLLTMVEGNIFRLDTDFDYLVDSQTIYVLRHSGFEFTTNVHGQMLQAAGSNATAVAAAVNYLNMGGISTYATHHPRAARLLAAVRARTDLHLLDRGLLEGACQQFGIPLVQDGNGAISPAAGHEYDFLLMIDRRAYTATLIAQQAERYEAASRTRKT